MSQVSRPADPGQVWIQDVKMDPTESGPDPAGCHPICDLLLKTSSECGMIVVYTPCEVHVQAELWRHLVTVISALDVPVCCGGDFNVVLSLEERRHCVGDKRGMAGFGSFVEEVGLLDLPTSGKTFTWFRTGSKASQLDRFLVSPTWIENFRGLEQFVLQCGVSDHAPVCLSSGVVEWDPKPFQFLNCWLEKRGHVKLMELEWHRISDEVVSSLSSIEKLRVLKGFLKLWNRESFGSVDLQIEVITDLLNNLEERDGGVEEQGELVETRRQLQGNLWRLLKYRSSIWRQKSWVLWLREGDRNTQLFQQATKIRDSFVLILLNCMWKVLLSRFFLWRG
ncbi:hypothetical protein V6N13_139878 [Hibiscus sabdariffa]